MQQQHCHAKRCKRKKRAWVGQKHVRKQKRNDSKPKPNNSTTKTKRNKTGCHSNIATKAQNSKEKSAERKTGDIRSSQQVNKSTEKQRNKERNKETKKQRNKGVRKVLCGHR